jgi:hypothetical protein
MNATAILNLITALAPTVVPALTAVFADIEGLLTKHNLTVDQLSTALQLLPSQTAATDAATLAAIAANTPKP